MVIVDSHGYQANALGLFAGDCLARQKIILCLGHAAEQRPNDRRYVTCGNPQAGVPVNNLGSLACDRHVSQNSDNEPRTRGWAIDRRDDRLVAIDDVVNEILGFLPGSHHLVEVARYSFDQAEISPRRKRLASPRHDNRVDVGVAVDINPHVGHLRVRFRIHGVEGFGTIERDPKNTVRRIVEFQFVVFGIAVRHGVFFLLQCTGNYLSARQAENGFRQDIALDLIRPAVDRGRSRLVEVRQHVNTDIAEL
ncbi:hypothetical protein ES703_62420 [subsurface metagenome]